MEFNFDMRILLICEFDSMSSLMPDINNVSPYNKLQKICNTVKPHFIPFIRIQFISQNIHMSYSRCACRCCFKVLGQIISLNIELVFRWWYELWGNCFYVSLLILNITIVLRILLLCCWFSNSTSALMCSLNVWWGLFVKTKKLNDNKKELSKKTIPCIV